MNLIAGLAPRQGAVCSRNAEGLGQGHRTSGDGARRDAPGCWQYAIVKSLMLRFAASPVLVRAAGSPRSVGT